MGTPLLARWATRWDREALVTMVVALAVEHGVRTDAETVGAAFEYALANPDEVRFCVAEMDRRVVGVASMHTSYSTWRAMPFGTLEDVYVQPEARRSGVATALLGFLKAHAVRRGYCRLELHVRHDNAGAQQCYREFGMRDTGYLAYELPLVDGEEDGG
jgi:ribosomal protein S18 acetylase RimI-like enzyme